jgi:hypothetical protein
MLQRSYESANGALNRPFLACRGNEQDDFQRAVSRIEQHRVNFEVVTKKLSDRTSGNNY